MSIVRSWILIEIQYCREHLKSRIGFIDPALVHQNLVKEKLGYTENYLLKCLHQYQHKTFTLLPYLFNFHWILLVIIPNLGTIVVFDSQRRDKTQYQDLIDMLNRACKRLCEESPNHSYAPTTENKVNTTFSCMRQKLNTNLCGFYLLNFVHRFTGDDLESNDMHL